MSLSVFWALREEASCSFLQAWNDPEGSSSAIPSSVLSGSCQARWSQSEHRPGGLAERSTLSVRCGH